MLLNETLLASELLAGTSSATPDFSMSDACLVSDTTLFASNTDVLASTVCVIPATELLNQKTFSHDMRVAPVGGGKDEDGDLSVIAKVFSSRNQSGQTATQIEPGTAVSVDTSTGLLVLWEDTAERRRICGFVYPTSIVLDQTDEVYGDVLMRGQISYNFITNSKTSAFQAALIGLRDRQLHVQGMPDWQ